jgi:hypothetical protein
MFEDRPTFQKHHPERIATSDLRAADRLIARDVTPLKSLTGSEIGSREDLLKVERPSECLGRFPKRSSMERSILQIGHTYESEESQDKQSSFKVLQYSVKHHLLNLLVLPCCVLLFV